MKKLLLFLTFTAITLFANSQDNAKILAMIGGHKSNDTIQIADFLKYTDITTSNKEYPIVSFVMLFSDKSGDYEMMSQSNKITDQMKDALSKMKSKDSKIKIIVFKDITVQSSQNKRTKIDDLVYKLKLE
jgi:hypothetical protein